MIIFFALTTPALLAGRKSATRRHWKPQHAARFTAGMLVDAWDRSPRTGKGRKVATIRITRDPWQQRTSLMTSDDYHREGLRWLADHGVPCHDNIDDWWYWFCQWRTRDELVWVVEFELVEVVGR